MADQSGEHVHWADDGRGQREVFLDGERIDCVTYCDTKVGIAVVAEMPLRCTDGKHIDYRPVWGEINVVPLEGV
ncbi:hypothetical protein PSH58_15585 [Pseudomonas hefeiensis]|uniref:Uncharacterized protein n=1 Tax=Pseudomonas hefeiensis TaxID=2738125 RepID=A0ABY9G410_9PSED|nr:MULTISPECIES: hypothetical protein [unclassified Pseudomonas]MEA1029428.1 hypothetical protein [Pseudomonas sp. N-137]WLH10328.1 hypothetical protein PSH57_15565 [Pseudomonas sp. FP205]WLH93405.1 hypothetical protein PSH58_15585 [Pseudomonas sp. FP53]WLI37693.1 hypothetical protein PSH74_15515 [Pseudomonas sp. FP821]